MSETKEKACWYELPKAAREALWEQFERHMREMFDECYYDVLHCFLGEDDIAQRWVEYQEDWFQREMQSPDCEWHFEEWLGERGLRF